MEAHLTPPHFSHLDISHFLREHSSCSFGVCVLFATLALITNKFMSREQVFLGQMKMATNLDVGLIKGPEVLHVVVGFDHHQVNVAA